MPHPDDIRNELPADMPREEKDRLVSVAARLAEPPIPAPTFRGNLRRRLEGDGAGTARGLQHLRRAIFSCAGSGAVLMLVAAVGLAGVGPFAA